MNNQFEQLSADVKARKPINLTRLHEAVQEENNRFENLLNRIKSTSNPSHAEVTEFLQQARAYYANNVIVANALEQIAAAEMQSESADQRTRRTA